MGSQLGTGDWASVEWLGKRDMQQNQLLYIFYDCRTAGPLPQITVVHLGENDLDNRLTLSLLGKIFQDLEVITVVPWSDILPRWGCRLG